MTAFEFLKSIKFLLPGSVERVATRKRKAGPLSNGEIRRWLRNKAVIINDSTPFPHDEICFPITKLVFFPGGERKTTVVDSTQITVLVESRLVDFKGR